MARINWIEHSQNMEKLCYQNIDSEDMVCSIDYHDVKEYVSKRINLNNYYVYHIYFITVEMSKVNRLSDYKGIWNLYTSQINGEKLKSGSYDNRYGRVYYGITRSSAMCFNDEMENIGFDELLLLIPRNCDYSNKIDVFLEILCKKEYDIHYDGHVFCDLVLSGAIDVLDGVIIMKSCLNLQHEVVDFHNLPIEFNPTLITYSFDIYSKN